MRDGKALILAAAAEALIKGGARDQEAAWRDMLRDPDASVRLHVALALVDLQDRNAVPVLIDLLAQLPTLQAYRVETVLFKLAGDQAPAVSLGRDEAGRQKCRDAWAAWWKQYGDRVDLARLHQTPPMLGYTLIVAIDQMGEGSAGRVLELGPDDKPRWEIQGLQFPLDPQIVGDDRVLVTENKGHRVTERDTRKGTIVWEKKIDNPIMAQRLPNGNTFIATNNEFLEVDRAGKDVLSANGPMR